MTKLGKSLQSPVTLAYIHRNKQTVQAAWAVYAYDFFTPIKDTGLTVEFTFLAYKRSETQRMVLVWTRRG